MLGLTKASKKHTSCRTRTNMSNSGEALKKKNKENMQWNKKEKRSNIKGGREHLGVY